MYGFYMKTLLQVREWQSKLRKEGRQLDRQILGKWDKKSSPEHHYLLESLLVMHMI